MRKTQAGSRPYRIFTSANLLALILVVGVLPGLACIPMPPGNVERAKVAACGSNLRQIYMACMLYEQEYGSFPFAGESAPAHEHFQLLVDTGFADEPSLFVCPSSRERAASADVHGKFKLSAGTCSYAYASKPLSSSSEVKKLLAADKELNHHGLNMVFVGGNVEYVTAYEEGQTWEDLTKGQLAK